MRSFALISILTFTYSFFGLAQNNFLGTAEEYENAGNYQKALEYYEKVYQEQQYGTEKSLYKLGEIYSLLNDGVANGYLKRYLDSYPTGRYCDYAHFWIGNNLLWIDHPDYFSAIQHFNTVFSISQNNELILKSYYCIGECYLQTSQYDKAKSSFQKVIDAPVIQVDWFYQIRNQSLNTISTIDEKDTDYSFNEGLNAMESGEYKKAFTLFSKVIHDKQNKNAKIAILKAAFCKFHLKEYNEVIKLLSKSNYNNLDERLTYNYLTAFSLIRKSNPDYKKAINPLRQLEINKSNEMYYLNYLYYYLGLCYEKTGDDKEAITWYRRFISNFPDDINYKKAKEAIENLNSKIERDKIYSYGNFYNYSIFVAQDSLIININEILADCYLQPNNNPGLILIPVAIEKVMPGQNIKIVLNQTPFIASRIGYLQVDAEVPRSKMNIFSPVIKIKVSQSDRCCLSGENTIIKKEITGIWGEGFSSFVEYDKSMNYEFSIESLGRSFQNNFGEPKKESPLEITIILGNSLNVANGLINDAKNKASNILYISGFGVD